MFVKGRAMTYSIREENEEDNGNDAGLNNTDGDELGESAPALSPRYATAINASEGLAGLEVPEPNESFPDAPYAGQIDTVIDDAHDYHADSDDEDGNGDGDGDEDSEEEEVCASVLVLMAACVFNLEIHPSPPVHESSPIHEMNC